ncbi:hypothetical protein BKA70DRAFT_1252642 [Coprinopsis sp. MPI-PUGE-AT-0042]|nr:hypothetical protein BKA70DRAFT_1252642 [Coprinopsis sp. MPI-PUGE-AT-0042]
MEAKSEHHHHSPVAPAPRSPSISTSERPLESTNSFNSTQDPTQVDLSIPAHLLPFEILGDVFVLTFPPYAFPNGLTFRQRAALIDLSLVCKRWRHASLVTPALWSSIEWDVEFEDMALARAWLERAAGTPKILKVVSTTHQNIYSGVPQHTDFDCLFNVSKLEHFLRDLEPWHSIHWMMYDISCLRFLTYRLRALASNAFKGASGPPIPSWPNMSHLAFEILGNWEPFSLETILDACPSTVKYLSLRSFYRTTEEASLLDRLEDLELPPPLLSNLTSLYLDCTPSPWLLLETIESCSNLVELGISVKHHGFLELGDPMDFTEFVRYKSQPIVLRNLKVLKVVRMCLVSEPSVLRALCVPRLETFHLEFEPTRGLDPGLAVIPHIVGLLLRSNCTVKNLCLVRARLPSYSDFHHLLGVFPDMECLTFQWIRKVYAMVKWMDSSMPLLTNLRRIESVEPRLYEGRFQQWNSGRERPVIAEVVEQEPEPVMRLDS